MGGISGQFSISAKQRQLSWGTIVGKLYAVKRGAAIIRIPAARIGDRCVIYGDFNERIFATIVGFESSYYIAIPDQEIRDVAPGARVELLGRSSNLRVQGKLKGSVFRYNGERIIGSTVSSIDRTVHELNFTAPSAFERSPIVERFISGVAALDLILPLGIGQRLCIDSPAGIGKSTLLGMLAKNSQCDCVVIGLIGERGREVGDFLGRILGDAINKSVVVVATSDEPPMRKVKAAELTFQIAAKLRSNGDNVLLLVDSLTRIARAYRDLGLVCGETISRGGLTPNVYIQLPALLELAGNDKTGTMTSFFTVLSEGVSDSDLLSQEIRSLTDGHIVLNRELFNSGWRPAIDLLSSISRLDHVVATPQHLIGIAKVKKLISRLKDKTALLFGGQADEELKRAIDLEQKLSILLSQPLTHKINFEVKINEFYSLVSNI